MEKPYAGECHNHIVSVAAGDHIGISYGAAGFCNILHAAPEGSFYVVRKREKGIGAERNIINAGKIRPLFFFCKGGGLFGEIFLPDAVGANILFILMI